MVLYIGEDRKLEVSIYAWGLRQMTFSISGYKGIHVSLLFENTEWQFFFGKLLLHIHSLRQNKEISVSHLNVFSESCMNFGI